MENPINSEKSRAGEDRLLAAIAHASAITQGLGILIAVVIYRYHRERSPETAFQALQAAVYQLASLLIVIVLWVIWFIFYMLTFIPLMNIGPNDAPPPIFWIGLISMIIPLLVMGFFSFYGLIGAAKTFQGKPFRYAFIGSWLETSRLWEEEML